MSRDVDRAFQHCVTLLQGGASVEDCIESYPEYADELRPMVETLVTTRQGKGPAMPRAARIRIKALVMAEWDSRRPSPKSYQRLFWMLPRWAAAAAIVVFVLVSGGTGIVMASDAAVPGAPLYPVKQIQEEARLWLARSPEAKTTIYTNLVKERAREIGELAEKAKSDSIAIAVDRLERHLYDADKLVRESLGGEQGTGLGVSSAFMEALDGAIAQRQSVSTTIQENLVQAPASMYPCLQHTFEAIHQGRERVRAAVEAMGRALPETSSGQVIVGTNLCPP